MEIRQIKTFARRVGKRFTTRKRDLLDCLKKKYEIDAVQPLKHIPKDHSIFLEIGFGMGEYLIPEILSNPSIYYICCEPFINGAYNLIKLASEQKVDNLSVWIDDACLLICNIPDSSLDYIRVLFPDPWPKRKHAKRRLINQERMFLFLRKLRKGGMFLFASDSLEYIEEVKNIAQSLKGFKNITENEHTPFKGYTKTKYHQKAEMELSKPKFLSFLKEE